MTIEEIIAEFRDMVLRADLHYRVWRVYSGEPQHRITYARPYSLFFDLSRDAHLGQAIILTYQLFHAPPNPKNALTTLSVHRLREVVGESLSPEAQASIDSEIAAAQRTHEKIEILRNKFLAHRDLTFPDDAFAKAGLTPADLQAQIEIGKRIHNNIGDVDNLNTGTYRFDLDADASLRRVLDALTPADG